MEGDKKGGREGGEGREGGREGGEMEGGKGGEGREGVREGGEMEGKIEGRSHFYVRRLKECGETMLVEISEILFNELAFFKLMQNVGM